MIPLGPVVARSRVKAARTAVWSYLAEVERRTAWWPGLQLEAGVGGAISVHGTADSGEAAEERDAEGTVDVWVEGHAVGFTWREAGEDRGTAVLMTLRSQGRETGVTITETGFDALAAPAERAAASQRGWQELLSGLAAAIEAGADADTAEGSEADREGAGASADAGAVDLADGADGADDSADGTDDSADGTAIDPADGTAIDPVEGTAEDPADQGIADPDESTTGALEVAPEAVNGEVDDAENAEVEIVEVEAEPQVGDHLELDTGSVRVVDAADVHDTTERGDVENDTVGRGDVENGAVENDTVENDTVDGGTVERGTAEREPVEDEATQHDTVKTQRLVAPEKPEEPDFDTLIRGA